MSKKKRKPKKNTKAHAIRTDYTLDIRPGDIEAIICALPLVAAIEIDPPIQQEINTALCISAAEKLQNRAVKFQSNELRVIASAISVARLLLSGEKFEFMPEIDEEWRWELSKHFFSYNRLEPIFNRIIEPYMEQLDDENDE